MAKKKNSSKRETRNLRIQQILFISIGVLIILSMVLALVAK
jgi:predicted nucleic acid-binding Zn ribbon protein